MKKSVMKKWVAALRSGEYAQTKGALCKEGEKYDRFCCLGVLTELYIQDHNAKKKKNAKKQIGWEKSLTDKELCFNEEEAVLANAVKEWAGVRTYHGELAHKRDVLTVLNDRGMSFKRIADIIEDNYIEL